MVRSDRPQSTTIVMVFAAQITGHWKSAIGEGEFKMLLRMIDAPMMVHPTF